MAINLLSIRIDFEMSRVATSRTTEIFTPHLSSITPAYVQSEPATTSTNYVYTEITVLREHIKQM